MKAVVRRLAYGALGLAFTRLVAGASVGRQGVGAFDRASRALDGPPFELANLALLGALAATAVAAGGLGAAAPAAPLSRRERRALRAAAIAGSALSLASASSDMTGQSALGIASNVLLLPASLALVAAAERGEGPLRASSRVAAGTVALHLATGLAFGALEMPATLRATHVGLGALAWLSMVVAASLALRVPVRATTPMAVEVDDVELPARVESDADVELVERVEVDAHVELVAAEVVTPTALAHEADAPERVPDVAAVPPAAPRRPPTLAVLLARGADF